MAKWQEIPEGRAMMWRGIRFLKKFSLEELVEVSGQSYGYCRKFCTILLEAGYLRRLQRADANVPGKLARYGLIRDTGPLPPMPIQNRTLVWDGNKEAEFEVEKLSTYRQAIWDWIRSHPEFSVPDLVALGLQRKSVQRFFGALKEAGYVTEVLPANGRAGQSAVYRLLRDTGKYAPRILRDGRILDRNLDQVVGREA